MILAIDKSRLEPSCKDNLFVQSNAYKVCVFEFGSMVRANRLGRYTQVNMKCWAVYFHSVKQFVFVDLGRC